MPSSSYHTANTHAPTEADEATQRSTQEEDGNPAKPAESSDPFEGLWGELVPCNSAMETTDLRAEKPFYTVGRSPDADIPISHPKISSKHCELHLVYNANNTTIVTVVDFSTNGTYVNGVRLGRGRHSMLSHGDELSLGVPEGLTNEEDFRIIFRSRITAIERAAGVAAGLSNGVVSGPVEHIRIRLQIQGNENKIYNGPWDAVRKIYKNYGIAGIYKGQVVTLYREAVGYGAYFWAYEKLVQRHMASRGIKREEVSPGYAVLFGAAAGYALWACIYPIDVIKSRMQTDGFAGESKKYKSTLDCVRKVWRSEGINGFSRGLIPTLIRSPFANRATFVFFELASRALADADI